MKIYTIEEISKMKFEEAMWKIRNEILPEEFEKYSQIILNEPKIQYENKALFKIADNVGITYEITKKHNDFNDDFLNEKLNKTAYLYIVDFNVELELIEKNKREKQKREEMLKKYGPNN